MTRTSLIAFLLLHLAVILAISHAIYLDIHVPLLPFDDCLLTQTLRANELLRQNSDTEQVDLFTKHTPHITLFLADFDLELHDDRQLENGKSLAQLNVTKVNSFLKTISKINFTEVVQGMDCTLSLSEDDPDNSKQFYTINGSFTMLNVQNTPCLKALSNATVFPLESFIKRPVIVPSWVASLEEPERSAAIYRSRKYGSPNIFEGFTPHLTVGFDPSTNNNSADTAAHHHWREDAMKQWNEGFISLLVNDGCSSSVMGVAVARNSIGGTVLANSRMGYWNVVEHDPFNDKVQAS